MTESNVRVDGSSRRREKLVESVSSSGFDKLTDKLLIEILIRLPRKPAILCKCVSRRFRSLISGSYFIRCYVNNHPGDNSFALYHQSKAMFLNIIPPSLMGTEIGISLCFLPCSEQTLKYLASNNGLVLCSEARRFPIVYFVCNPLTKQWVALPPPPSNIETTYVGFICKTQYSCDDDHEKAGEFEMGSKTSFKVVRLQVVRLKAVNMQQSVILKLEIFCSVSGRWTEKDFTSELIYDWCYSWRSYEWHSAVVCHDLLHWNDVTSRCYMFTYDPYNGECRTIKLPHVIRESRLGDFRQCLGECCGQLRYANFSLDNKNYRVWELKDYGNGNGGEWLLLHNVHVDEMKSMVQTINKNSLSLLYPHPLNQDIVIFLCSSSQQLVEYNMRNKLLQLLRFLQHGKIKRIFGHIIHPFVLPCWPTAVPQIQLHDLTS